MSKLRSAKCLALQFVLRCYIADRVRMAYKPSVKPRRSRATRRIARSGVLQPSQRSYWPAAWRINMRRPSWQRHPTMAPSLSSLVSSGCKRYRRCSFPVGAYLPPWACIFIHAHRGGIDEHVIFHLICCLPGAMGNAKLVGKDLRAQDCDW